MGVLVLVLVDLDGLGGGGGELDAGDLEVAEVGGGVGAVADDDELDLGQMKP